VFLDAEIEQLLSNIDLNGNGVINYSEFVTVASNIREMLTENNLKESFKQFDSNGDGKIEISELKRILNFQWEEEDEFKELMNSIDKEYQDSIDFDDFKRMMRVFLRRHSNLLSAKRKISDPFGLNILLQAKSPSFW
jgi:Ca2+-binding EF-hand superfamily protein